MLGLYTGLAGFMEFAGFRLIDVPGSASQCLAITLDSGLGLRGNAKELSRGFIVRSPKGLRV